MPGRARLTDAGRARLTGAGGGRPVRVDQPAGAPSHQHGRRAAIGYNRGMTTADVGRRAGGRPARLSRDRIVAAAETVVRTEGIDALSMRRVARAVRCSPMALYRHVADRDELLRGVLDALAPTLRRPPPSSDPRRAITRVLTITHDWLVDHPWVIDLLPSHRMGWSVAWVTDDVVAAFRSAGLRPAAAARAHEVVWHHLVGEVTTRHSRAWQSPGGSAPGDGIEHRHAVTAQAHDQFLHGLSALLDGLLPADGSTSDGRRRAG